VVYRDPKIEHQVDLNNVLTSTTSTTYVLSSYRIIASIDPTRYVNPSFYFEAVFLSNVSGVKAYTELYNVTDGVSVSGSEVFNDTSVYLRKRSGVITLPSTAKDYTFRYKVDSGTRNYIRSVRIIIVDNYTTLTKLEHQIEIGDYDATMSDILHELPYPKTYLFEGDKFDGTLTVYFEATIYVSAKTAQADLYNVTDGVSVGGSLVSTTSTTPVRVRSGAITLISGKQYRVRYRNNVAGKTTYINGAKIIIRQTATEITKTQLVKYCGLHTGTGITYLQRLPDQIYLDKSNLPIGLTFYFEVEKAVVYANSDLYNVTDASSVSGTDHTGSGVWRSGALTLLDLKEYDSRIRTTNPAYSVRLIRAWVIIDYELSLIPVEAAPHTHSSCWSIILRFRG